MGQYNWGQETWRHYFMGEEGMHGPTPLAGPKDKCHGTKVLDSVAEDIGNDDKRFGLSRKEEGDAPFYTTLPE